MNKFKKLRESLSSIDDLEVLKEMLNESAGFLNEDMPIEEMKDLHFLRLGLLRKIKVKEEYKTKEENISFLTDNDLSHLVLFARLRGSGFKNSAKGIQHMLQTDLAKKLVDDIEKDIPSVGREAEFKRIKRLAG